MQKVDVVILASGSGLRMGGQQPKQFQSLAGKLILEYSLDFFANQKEINNIILALSEPFLKNIALIIDLGKYKNVFLVEGGITRQDSAKSALEKVTSEFVMIHDAARPLINRKFFESLLYAIENKAGVVPVKPITNTVYQINTQTMIFEKTLDRNILFNVETPQYFRTNLIKKAHNLANKENLHDFTDDAQLINYYGLGEIKCVVSEGINIKITTPQDLILARSILEKN